MKTEHLLRTKLVPVTLLILTFQFTYRRLGTMQKGRIFFLVITTLTGTTVKFLRFPPCWQLIQANIMQDQKPILKILCKRNMCVFPRSIYNSKKWTYTFILMEWVKEVITHGSVLMELFCKAPKLGTEFAKYDARRGMKNFLDQPQLRCSLDEGTEYIPPCSWVKAL